MDPETLSDNMVQVIAVTVTQNLSDSGNVYRIYNSSKDLLYERNSCKIDGTEPLSVLSQEQPCSYLVKRAGDATWLLYACRSTVGGKTYLLESLTDISDLYQERESYYDWYTGSDDGNDCVGDTSGIPHQPYVDSLGNKSVPDYPEIYQKEI